MRLSLLVMTICGCLVAAAVFSAGAGARDTLFAGAIKDARIYGQAISAEEIGSLNADAASDIPPLPKKNIVP